MFRFRVTAAWLFSIVAFATAAGASVAPGAGAAVPYNFVMRFLHPDRGNPNLPDCTVHERTLSRRIRNSLKRRGQDRRRQLSGGIDCSSFCKNVAPGYCFIASGGICNDRSVSPVLTKRVAL